MTSLKVVLLTESSSLSPEVPLTYKYYGQKLWATIETIVNELSYGYETVELSKLDFQEYESVNKFLNADIVIMVRSNHFHLNSKNFFHFQDVTNQDRRPTFMYHKGNRESVDCMDDIVLIQASNLDNDNTIQDLKVNIISIKISFKKKEFVFFCRQHVK
jgi:hypothetical protein